MRFNIDRMLFGTFKMIFYKHKVVMVTIRMDNIDDSLTKTSIAFVDVRSAANFIRAIQFVFDFRHITHFSISRKLDKVPFCSGFCLLPCIKVI